MLRFNHYLTENALYLTEEIESNDAKGKLHELLTAYHLSHTDDSQKHLPERFAAETTNKKGKKVKKTPQETHDEIKNSISEEDYNEAHNRAKEAADSIREHLKKQHGIQDEHMKGVYWTSNKKDHKELTGIDDPNSNADLMIKHTHPETGEETHHGISLKVGSENPNLANPGFDQLDRLTKSDKTDNPSDTTANHIIEKHNKKLKELGYTGTQAQNHAQYKSDKLAAANTPEKQRSVAGEQSKVGVQRELAAHYANRINQLGAEGNHDKVKHLLRSLMAPQTHFPHIKAWAQTPKAGKKGKTAHIVSNDNADLENLMSGHQHGYEAVHKGGIQFDIHHKNPDGTKGAKVASIGIKGGSGIAKGFAGFVKAAPKSKKPKTTAVQTNTTETNNTNNPYLTKENYTTNLNNQMVNAVFSGNLTESNNYFKSVLAEKIAEKMQVKKKNAYKSDCNEAKGSFRAGYNKAKNRFSNISKQIQQTEESVLGNALNRGFNEPSKQTKLKIKQHNAAVAGNYPDNHPYRLDKAPYGHKFNKSGKIVITNEELDLESKLAEFKR